MTQANAPLVSIVITTYNYADFLPASVQSAIDQSYRNIEIIVVNDGSTDGTDSAIKPFLDKKCLRYVKQKNAGQANAKNRGIAEARGEFVAFLDADDYWMPDKLSEQIPLFLKDSKVGVVYTRAEWVDTDGNSIEIHEGLPSIYSGWITDKMIIDNFIPFSSAVVRRECFDKYGVFDESLAMAIDWDLWLRLSLHYKVEFVNRRLIAYRVGHSGQMSKNQDKRRAQSDQVLKDFLSRNPGAVSSTALRRARSYNHKSLGKQYFRQQALRSIKEFALSLCLNPFQASVYYYIALNLIPTKIYAIARDTIKHRG